MKEIKTLSELHEDSKMLDFLIEALLVGGVFAYQIGDNEFKASAGTINSFHSGYGETPKQAISNLIKVIHKNTEVKLNKQLV